MEKSAKITLLFFSFFRSFDSGCFAASFLCRECIPELCSDIFMHRLSTQLLLSSKLGLFSREDLAPKSWECLQCLVGGRAGDFAHWRHSRDFGARFSRENIPNFKLRRSWVDNGCINISEHSYGMHSLHKNDAAKHPESKDLKNEKK